MAIGQNSHNKGIALIVTLTIITLLVTISLELNRQVRGAVMDSAAFRDRATLRHMIHSGVAMAETILTRDKQDTQVDSIQEDWANPEKIEAYLSHLAFDKGDLSIRIIACIGVVQINLDRDAFSAENAHHQLRRLGFIPKWLAVAKIRIRSSQIL